MFRERVEPRSTARHQEQADGGCSRARACAVRLQRNVKPEERGLSPEGPRGQGPAPGHRAPPGAGTRRATAWGVGEGFPSRVFLLINVGAICPPRPYGDSATRQWPALCMGLPAALPRERPSASHVARHPWTAGDALTGRSSLPWARKGQGPNDQR